MKKLTEYLMLTLFVVSLGVAMIVASPFLAIGFFYASPIQIDRPLRGVPGAD